MIYGIGTDIVSIQRIKIVYLKFRLQFVNKVLSYTEFEYFKHLQNNQIINFLAKRFCVKEAFAKSVHTGLKNPVLFNNISLMHNHLGSPYLIFHGKLKQWVENKKIVKIHVSLSDEKNTVIAFVISEKNE